MSVHWPIIRRLLSSPRRVAVVDDARTYRGLDLLGGMLHVAGHVRRCCASKTLGLLLPTSGAFPLAALAGWSAGKTIVPLNYLLKPEELAYVVKDCEADTIVTVKAMLDFVGHRPDVKNLIVLDELGFKGVPPLRVPAGAGRDDLAVILYTSGTSGRPKGVMLTHGNLSSNVAQVLSYIALSRDDVALGVLPQFHSFGLTVLTLMPLARGLRAVYSARFVPSKVMRLIREHRPTIFIAIPSMYNALLSAKDASPDDWKGVRFVVSGGEPLPDSTFERFRERFGVTLNEGYGLTETSPVTNWCRPDEWRRHSVGRPLPDVRERIVDPDGREVPRGHDGEVQIAGPNVMRGYFKLPDETGAAFTPDGYLRTGDMGRFDEQGHLFITGRIKDMLIIGGENVFPREIEEVLNRHAGVGASAVVGLADPMRGEVPVAFVEMKEGAAFDEVELKRWCRESLAGYKVPDQVRRLDALPRNPTGKILRRDLKKLL